MKNMNISNGLKIPSLDYLPNESDQNNFLPNENFDNFSNDNINDEIYMDNPNFEVYENDNYKVNNNIYLDKNNFDIENTQAAFVQTLNLQIKQLQKLLEDKNKEFDELNNENNKLKILLIQEQKKLIEKDNLIHSENVKNKNLEKNLEKYKLNEENLQNKIKELNYKIIELNQNVISKENMNQFNEKIKNIIETGINNDKNGINNIIINEKINVEITKLKNKIDELEIKNNKIVFENETLNYKISKILSDKEDKSFLEKNIYDTQIKNLNKLISVLTSKISECYSGNNRFNNNNNKINNLISEEIIDKFNALENKLNNYDKENGELRQENQNIKNELDELKLIAESKEKIIQKLQNDFEMMEREYNNNNSLPNNLQRINNNEINSNDYNQYINELMNKQNMLEIENNNLRNGLKQMTKNINEANEIYFKRKANYDNNIKIRDDKLKEYKNKISILKIKINELYNEINILKSNRGNIDNNLNSFLSQNNNDMINNQFKTEQNNLLSNTSKIKRKDIPFELNLENNQFDNINSQMDKDDIFGDIKISEVPKINETKERINSNYNKEDLKYIQEYKDILNKVEEQLKEYN